MGGAGKKLRQWAEYEYGVAVGNLPGNCLRCEEAHRLLPTKLPPCRRWGVDHPRQCRKFLLYPAYRGLNPKNAFAVQLYQLAERDVRVGMEGVLISTLSPSDAWAVIGIYAHHLGSPLLRQRTFELMMTLAQVALARRQEQEQKLRDRLKARK